MSRTAMSIIRQESWAGIASKMPPTLLKKYKKALIDCEVSSQAALLSFVYAVANGELLLEQKPEAKQMGLSRRRFASDVTGVFDDCRILIKTRDGQIVNPLPFSNKYIENI